MVNNFHIAFFVMALLLVLYPFKHLSRPQSRNYTAGEAGQAVSELGVAQMLF